LQENHVIQTATICHIINMRSK